MHQLARDSVPPAVIVLLAFLAGCVSTQPPTEPTLSQLPPARVNDNVVLEVGFAHISAHDQQWLDELWTELDEQHLPPDERQRLLTNGLRCGLAGEQLPEMLRVAMQGSSSETLSVADTAANRQHAIRRLHLRAGSRSELVTSTDRQSMTILLDDGESICGHQFQAAQALFAIQTSPANSSRASIQLTPEIHFGDTKQRYVGKDGAFVLEAKRDNRVFGDLRIEAVLAPGQTLVVTCDGPAKSLGGNAFRTADGETQKLLLVRLAHAQDDDLFEQDELLDSL